MFQGVRGENKPRRPIYILVRISVYVYICIYTYIYKFINICDNYFYDIGMRDKKSLDTTGMGDECFHVLIYLTTLYQLNRLYNIEFEERCVWYLTV